jgi:hypothetical protein
MRIAQSGSTVANNISRDIFQNRNRLPSVSSASFSPREIVMPSFRKWHRMSQRAIAFPSMAAALLCANAAFASQGPGGGPGTAGSSTQLAMAIIVYGACALVLGAGLIGAARKHGERAGR